MTGALDLPVIDVTCVDGTWGWHGLLPSSKEWTHPKHDCQKFLREHRLRVRCDANGRGFSWTTQLEGLMLLRRLTQRRAGLVTWEVGGVNFYDFHKPMAIPERFHVRGAETHCIAHSHGGNLPFVAAAMGLKINVLVTISTPIRFDVLRKFATQARPNIGWHIHYWSVGDPIQAAGEWGDGRVGWVREHPEADENIMLPAEAGHTGLLENPKFRGELLTAVERIHMRHGNDDFLKDRTEKILRLGLPLAVS